MKNIMIIAGEASGDLHGASLISELKKIDESLNVFGIGGNKMESAGMKINYHINKMAFLGFAEVLKHIPFIKKVQKNLINIIKEKKIQNVILIDYPGFNLSFAKKIKKLKNLEIKIIYYISPQIWAWGAGRIKKIKKLIDKMIVVFPFEKKLYEDAGVKVEFVGHPLVEKLNNYIFLTKEELYKKLNLDNSKEILLILPGSRAHEVESILPEALNAAEMISNKFNLQIVIAASSNIDKKLYEDLLNENFNLVSGNTYDLMKYSKFGIIKSGTSTLEAALLELPMVIVYKTGLLTYLIGKKLVKIKNIGMANIILGEKIVPELIQNDVSKETIYKAVKKILSDKILYNSIKEKLGSIKQRLGNEGASKKAAQLIYTAFNEV